MISIRNHWCISHKLAPMPLHPLRQKLLHGCGSIGAAEGPAERGIGATGEWPKDEPHDETVSELPHLPRLEHDGV
jgi:hypothetical protein